MSDAAKEPVQNTSAAVPLAIVGIGCLFPKAEGSEAFWTNIKGGVDAVTDIPASHWKAGEYFDADPSSPDMTYAKRGAFLEAIDFNPLEFGIAPNNLEAIDTTQLLGLVVAQQALRDAGYSTGSETKDGRHFNRRRTSVILGVTGALEMVVPLGARLGHPIWRKALADSGVQKNVADEVVERIAASYVPWQENSFPGLLGNVAAGRIANRFDLGGTNCVVDAACASSLSALHLAAMELYAGRSDMAITGGMDTFNDIFMYMCFSKTPALSPTGASRPFSAMGDGTILGEGLGVVVIKRLADAQRDGDNIRAVIRGIGSSSDGKGNAVYAPSADGQVRCLLSAYEQAGVSPTTIELVEAHGTGTKVGDAVEAKALEQVFSSSTTEKKSAWCAVGSVKSMVGHTKAAAGIAGLIKATLALEHKVLPPTIKVEKPLESLEAGKGALYVNTEKRPWIGNKNHPRRAGVSAFGFGGSNFHCVLEEATPTKKSADWDDTAQILSFSGNTCKDIAIALRTFDKKSSWKEMRMIAAELRSTFNPTDPCRLVIVLQKSEADIAKTIDAALHMLEQNPDREKWSTPTGMFFGSGAPGKLALLFPGQGSQYVGMLRDLACQFPEMLEQLGAVEEISGRIGPTGNGSVMDRLWKSIYPVPVFTETARAANEKSLADTRIAQRAIGAVSAGAWQVLQRFGIDAQMTAGHSFGELVALWAAGRLDPLHTVAAARADAMAAASAKNAGAMLAVMSTASAVTSLLKTENLQLIIANKNAPEQLVLSGAATEIERAEALLKTRSIRFKRLPVSAAFHSELVANAELTFATAIKNIPITPGRIPVFSNTTGTLYPSDPANAAKMLAAQLAQPVEFVTQIEKMYDTGARTFIEVGPSGKLSALVRAILQGRDHEAVALDASSGKRSGIVDLALALAQLAALGHVVNLARWDEDAAKKPAGEKKAAMSVPLTGANYIKPRPPIAPRPQHRLTGSAPSPQKEGIASLPEEKPIAATPTLSHALQVTQQSILALQRMQEQTAQLHQQYLRSQETAQQTLASLMQQQIQLLTGAAVTTTIIRQEIIAPVPVRIEAPRAEPVRIAEPAAIVKPQQVIPVVPAAVVKPTGDTERVLISVIAEKTGYPPEMLELDMSLDADLGIDSIKRVEIFSALQTQMPNAPVVKPEDLGRLQTLRQVVTFLDAQQPTIAETPAQPSTTAITSTSAAQEILIAVVADKTGYPPEMLELDMSLDADLGIDSIKRVEIFSALQTKMPHAPVVKPEDLGRLQTLRQVVAFLEGGTTQQEHKIAPAAVEPKRTPTVATRVEAGTDDILDRQVLTVVPLSGHADRELLPLDANGEVWVTEDGAGLAAKICAAFETRQLKARIVKMDAAPKKKNVAGLLILAPHHPSEAFIRDAFELIQRVGPALREAAKRGGAFLVSASFLDGCFGLNGHTPRNPLTGGLAGLVKTVSHEWAEVACKSLDLPHELDDLAALAEQVTEEVLLRGPAEVGISSTGRCETRLVKKSLNGEVGKNALTREDVVVVTGGARGVTAAVSVALAKAYGCKLLLLGRSPEPTTEAEWLSPLKEESEIKRALAARGNGSATPKRVEEAYRRVIADREVRGTLSQIRELGATVMYRSLDVRDVTAMATAIAEARAEMGPIRGIIHGAGVLQDRLIQDKTTEQFDEVFSTKVGGFNALLDAVKADTLKVIVAFSSTTGRFGRKGQVAYAAANEVLNKLAQREAHQRPACRVLSMNWGPWEGGMVTPQLRRIFENEGVGLIPLQAGADYLVREMSTPAGGPVEILILGPVSQRNTNGASPKNGAAPSTGMTVAFERKVDVESHPVLRSHILKGKAVVPAALMVEWLAHGAMHEHPGLAFQGFDDLHIFKGITLAQDESLIVRVATGPAISLDGKESVTAELQSGKNSIHARATIILGDAIVRDNASEELRGMQAYSVEQETLYSEGRLFHGPLLQAITQVEGWSDEGIVGQSSAAPLPSTWMKQPLRSAWVTDPLAIDAAFQLMILWCFEAKGVGSLPTGIAQYRQYAKAFPQGGMRISVRVSERSEHAANADIEFADQAGTLIARMTGYSCVMDATLETAFALNQLAE